LSKAQYGHTAKSVLAKETTPDCIAKATIHDWQEEGQLKTGAFVQGNLWIVVVGEKQLGAC
jgi:hypothetical protein